MSTAEQYRAKAAEFAELLKAACLPAEARDHDHLELGRIALRYSGFFPGRLRRLIDALNSLG